MDVAELSQLLDRIRGVRVLCVGDLVLDQFVYGDTRRVSREAPVPVLDEKRRELILGAAGNVVRNVGALGAQPILVSVVGDDPEGQAVSRLVDAEPDAEADLLTVHGRPTPVKTRYVSNGQQLLCIDRDPPGVIGVQDIAALAEMIAAAAKEADVAILSDYGRGVITPEICRGAVAACAGVGIRLAVDPRGRDYSRYDGAFLIKPNALELAEESGLPTETDAEVEAALNKVMDGLKQTEVLIVTRSAKGISVLERGKPVRHLRSRPRAVYDVSGAGDTTIAMLALALGAGAGIEAAMQAADRAAGLVVGKVGTATVRPDELVEAERAQAPHDPSGKIQLLAAARERVARWRAHGLRVGFTNGCFDILHPGHVSLLRQARAMCDRLIVGVNDDASVKRLKGDGRPVNDLGARARVLASLEAVDCVVGFSEDTPVKLIEALTPEVYVKGADYTVETLRPLGGDAVLAYGGDIRLVPLEEGHSTSGIIARLSDT